VGCIGIYDSVFILSLCRSISPVHYLTSVRTHTIHLSALSYSTFLSLSGDDKLFSISSRHGRRALVGGCFRRSFSAAAADTAAEHQQELVWERARPGGASASGGRLRPRGW